MTGYTCSAGNPLNRLILSLYNICIGENALKSPGIFALYVFAACLLAFIGFACNSTDSYVGKYQAIDMTDETHKENFIELMENRQGVWTCCDGEVPFTWYVKDNDLRINTKEGGIMVGKLKNESFIITLPGNKMLSFVKVLSPG